MKRLVRNLIAFGFGLLLGGALALVANVVYAQEAVVCPEGYICTQSGTDSTVTTNGNMTTTINQPPPSAISPQFSSGSNSDLCTIGVAGAVQTQILGISAGTTFTEENCLRLKNAKTLYDMGMKVAAVSTMCQDPNVFKAMQHAGTPCPYMGKIGAEAQLGWDSHVETTKEELRQSDELSNTQKGVLGVGGIAALLLLL